ncbi:MAG: hypothetical protein IPK75_20115 [Acidobacteria bacterium]|nr:hypothetical protein [Acidobacteriota bacterium]
MSAFTPDFARECRQLWDHPWSIAYAVQMVGDNMAHDFEWLWFAGCGSDQGDWFTAYVHPEAEC